MRTITIQNYLVKAKILIVYDVLNIYLRDTFSVVYLRVLGLFINLLFYNSEKLKCSLKGIKID